MLMLVLMVAAAAAADSCGDADVSLPRVSFRFQDRKKVGWLFAGGYSPANDIRRENTLVFTRRRWLPICSPQRWVCFPLCIYVWSIMSNRQSSFESYVVDTKWYCDTRHRDADGTEDDGKQFWVKLQQHFRCWLNQFLLILPSVTFHHVNPVEESFQNKKHLKSLKSLASRKWNSALPNIKGISPVTWSFFKNYFRSSSTVHG